MKNKEENPEDEFAFAKMLAGEEGHDKSKTESEEDKAERQLRWLYIIFTSLFAGVGVGVLGGWDWVSWYGAFIGFVVAIIHFFFLAKKCTNKLRKFLFPLLSVILFFTLFSGLPYLVAYAWCILSLVYPYLGCPLWYT